MRRFFKTKRGTMVRVNEIAAYEIDSTSFEGDVTHSVVITLVGGHHIVASRGYDQGYAADEYDRIELALIEWWGTL